jgi:hypothetical protein
MKLNNVMPDRQQTDGALDRIAPNPVGLLDLLAPWLAILAAILAKARCNQLMHSPVGRKENGRSGSGETARWKRTGPGGEAAPDERARSGACEADPRQPLPQIHRSPRAIAATARDGAPCRCAKPHFTAPAPNAAWPLP